MQGTPGDSSAANQRTPLVRNRSSRRPRPLRRRSSGFDQGLYSASAYKVIEAPLKRSQSQASLHAGTTSGDTAQQPVEHSGDDKDALTGLKLLLLTICMAGVQFTWSVELSYGTPYLLSLELPKELTALVWLAGPLSGLIIQPLIGAYSDRCTSSLGKRRPYIIFGGVLVCFSMLGVAYAKELGVLGVRWFSQPQTPEEILKQEKLGAIFSAVLAFYILDFSLNAVQASCRALILDVPPLWQQQIANAWAARMSNIAMVIGYFTGFVDLIKFLPFLGDSQVKVFCLIAIFVFILTLGITCLTTKEKVYVPEREQDEPWYHALGYIWRAFTNLPNSVQRLCNVQFFAWLGWFPFLFYSTTWVSDIYFVSNPMQDPDSWAKGTRAGSFALLCYAVVSVVAGIILPWMTESEHFKGVTVKNVYTGSIILFSISLLLTFFVETVLQATIIVAIIGIPWAVVLWVPFALVGEYISYESDKLEEAKETAKTLKNGQSKYGATQGEVVDGPVSLEANDDDDDDDDLDAGLLLGVHNMYIVFPQFAVAIIAAVIFKIVSAVEDPTKPTNPAPAQDSGVAWVLRFGGIMGLFAAILSRRIIEVPRRPGQAAVVVVAGGH
ncbi:major facilitator superfamily domain-containing protein [Umbelopsis sp. AD052]|nr:major facilitator superfamily domain-containing protein [Umbelopsis sp. AD052]